VFSFEVLTSFSVSHRTAKDSPLPHSVHYHTSADTVDCNTGMLSDFIMCYN